MIAPRISQLACPLALAVLALAALAGAAGAETASWHFEKVLPPQQPGESSEEHLSRAPVGLGKVGDIEFFAPNRGLLITEGSPPTVPPGVWTYNGKEWHELASVCGATDGRIAWAGPDDFWTVSDGRPGAAAHEHEVPLQDNSLCHFDNGEVVSSYATHPFLPSSYQAMHAAACLSPADCWFGGDLLPAPEPGVKVESAFQLHWNGASVSEEPYPAEHAIEDLRKYGNDLFESVRLRRGEKLRGGESASAPPTLHLITPIGVQPTFLTLTPGFPQYDPQSRPYLLDSLHLASNEQALWGAANPLRPSASEIGEEEVVPGEVTIVHDSEGVWSQVLGFGTDPASGNPFTVSGRSEGENEQVTSIASEPASPDALLALTTPENSERGAAASAMVARISPSGEVSERATLPVGGEGVGAKGAADKITCPAPNDCWLTTTQGWLFHYSNRATGQLPENGDPDFSHLITSRPEDESTSAEVLDTLPIDNSGLPGETPATTASLVPTPTVEPELQVPVPLLTHLKSKLHGTTLELRFHLAVKARVRLVAKRRKQVVADTPMRTLAAGNRKLLLVLNRRRWPTKLDLQTHALAPLPTTSTRGAGTDSVGTGFFTLPKERTFAQAGRLP